jgi:hypothetical protein
MPGQAFGSPERGQRVGLPAARQLELGADVVDRQRHRGIGFRSDGALGALQPGLGLVQAPLPGQHGSERHIGDAGGRLVGPAVPLGQVDRPPAELRRARQRPGDLTRRLVGQGNELEIWPPDPARHRGRLFQVRLAPARLRRVHGLG